MDSSMMSWTIIICKLLLVCHDSECVKNPPDLEVITGGCLRFLTKLLEDEAILDIMDHHCMAIFTFVPN